MINILNPVTSNHSEHFFQPHLFFFFTELRLRESELRFDYPEDSSRHDKKMTMAGKKAKVKRSGSSIQTAGARTVEQNGRGPNNDIILYYYFFFIIIFIFLFLLYYYIKFLIYYYYLLLHRVLPTRVKIPDESRYHTTHGVMITF